MPLKISPDDIGFNARGDGKFNQPFAEQVDFLRQKLDLPTEHYDDIIKSGHDRAFVVAGATKVDLLNDLHQAIEKASAEGKSIGWFRQNFADIVKRNGWHGWTGEDTQEGRDWRTRVIYKTNLATSYAAGRWQQLNSPTLLKNRPYWKYIHNDTVAHPRPLHLSWDGLILRHDDPWWQSHFPPNGWGCRCRVTAVRANQYQGDVAPDDGTYEKVDRNGEVHTIPKGIDYGWDYAPGAFGQYPIQGFIDNKAAGLPAQLATAFKDEVVGVNLAAARSYVLINGLANERKLTEFAYVYDAAGNILVKKKGGESHVSFTDAEMTRMRDAQGVVLVHNHPGGRSLSKPDLSMANEIDAEIYAIGHNDVEYSGKMLNIKKFESLYSDIDGVLKYYFLPLIRANKLTVDEADLYHHHLINTVLKASGAITYEVNGLIDLPLEVERTLTKLLEHFK